MTLYSALFGTAQPLQSYQRQDLQQYNQLQAIQNAMITGQGMYNMAQQIIPPQWVFNGKACSLQEFAEQIWPDDEAARLMFILKHGGV